MDIVEAGREVPSYYRHEPSWQERTTANQVGFIAISIFVAGFMGTTVASLYFCFRGNLEGAVVSIGSSALTGCAAVFSYVIKQNCC